MGGYLTQLPLKNKQYCALESSNLPALIFNNKYSFKRWDEKTSAWDHKQVKQGGFTKAKATLLIKMKATLAPSPSPK
jgi:hypothetical protein